MGKLLIELKKDINLLISNKERSKDSIKKSEFLKKNGNKLIVFVKSKFGYYCIYNNEELRVVNLLNNANGYHIYDGVHPLAKPGDFKERKNLDKLKKWNRSQLNKVLSVFEKKQKSLI